MISPYPSADQEAKPLVKVELVQSCMRSMMGMDWVDVEETWALGSQSEWRSAVRRQTFQADMQFDIVLA